MNACSNIRRLGSSKFMITSLRSLRAHNISIRERQRLVERYDGWQKMRETALKNAGDNAPEEVASEYPPPPPEDEEDLGDVSIDHLSAAAMDAEVAQALDESGMERVPMADPGIGVHISDEPSSPIGQSPHVRRKSVLPGTSGAFEIAFCHHL